MGKCYGLMGKLLWLNRIHNGLIEAPSSMMNYALHGVGRIAQISCQHNRLEKRGMAWWEVYYGLIEAPDSMVNQSCLDMAWADGLS